jgi:hypothetical protein
MNKNWPRWIFASISKHFNDRRDGLPLFIEGQKRNTHELASFLELRVDGPHLTEVSKGDWLIEVEINILVQTAMNETNYHVHHTNCGIAQAAFTTIEVYRYGTGPDDDQSFFCCMQLLQDRRGRDRIELNQLGQIDKDVPLMHATVEGHYKMRLCPT